MNIKDMVKDGKKVVFKRYVNDTLIYETECGFEFPVPVEDTGDGAFLAEDKAMFLMRYIRKEIDRLKNDTTEIDFIDINIDVQKENVNFTRFRKNEFFFITKDGIEFPVPLAHIGRTAIGSIMNRDMLQQHIDNHLASIEQEKNNQAS
jgi:hypothetical protein